DVDEGVVDGLAAGVHQRPVLELDALVHLGALLAQDQVLRRAPVDAALAAGHEEQRKGEEGAARDPHDRVLLAEKWLVVGPRLTLPSARGQRAHGPCRGRGDPVRGLPGSGGSGWGRRARCATVRECRTLPSGRRRSTAGSIRPPGSPSSPPSSWSASPATT